MWRSLSLILITTLLFSCKNEPKSPPSEQKRNTPVVVPQFDGQRAYDLVKRQLDFGYRVPGTAPHKACGDWIADEMRNFGATVSIQNFKVDFMDQLDVPCFNIIAQFNSDHPKRLCLAAHWDSRYIAEKDDERQDQPIPGADDGGSGVAVMLEIARLIADHPIDVGVDFVFFDAEDQGDNKSNESWAKGSQYWSTNLVPANYTSNFAILLDMVGSEGALFGREEYSYQNAREVQDKVWGLAQRMGYSDFFRNETTGRVNDDHYWVLKNTKLGVKMIDIIHQKEDRQSFGDYHHRHDDNMDIISKRTLRVVGQVVTAALYNEAAGTL